MTRKGLLSGFALAEVVVAVSLMTLFLAALVSTQNLYVRSARMDPMRAKAVFLAEEGIEKLKLERAQSWSALAGGTETIDGAFTRQTQLADSGDHGKDATVTVSWSDEGNTASVSLSTYIVNLYDN